MEQTILLEKLKNLLNFENNEYKVLDKFEIYFYHSEQKYRLLKIQDINTIGLIDINYNRYVFNNWECEIRVQVYEKVEYMIP